MVCRLLFCLSDQLLLVRFCLQKQRQLLSAILSACAQNIFLTYFPGLVPELPGKAEKIPEYGETVGFRQ
jgi:hypothetical protein